MSSHVTQVPYPQELRERAVRMVAEIRPHYQTEWSRHRRGRGQLGVGSSETARKSVRQAEIDSGQRPGTTSKESAELRRRRTRRVVCAR